MSESENTPVEASGESGLSLEDALKELAKARREAADKRVKNRELQEKAEKYDTYLNSQKTELEKLTGAVKDTESRAEKLAHRNLQLEVALEAGLDKDFASLLTGDEDEMRKVAEKLAGATSKKETQTSNDPYLQKSGGTPPKADGETFGSILTDMWKQL